MFFLMLDIGQDGAGIEANALFARDAAALMLQYYDSDYTPVAGTGTFNLFSADAVGLYNGNIAALSTATYGVTPLLKLFRYDKLNRIKQMQTAGISAGEWGSLTDNFSTEYRYDYNGNILSLQRRNANAVLMHQINYTYNAKNNRLQAITATGINSSNYSYDAIGNLANDSGENIQVSWNAMNKVKQVNLPNNRQLQFSYSPTGQRQIKRSADKTEYYLHDATGNIMCIYELSGKYLTVKERTIYGSKRIGVYRQRIQLSAYTGFGQAILLPGSGLVNVLHPSPIISPDGRQYLEGSNRLQVIGVNRAIAQTSTISYAYKKGTVELKGLSPSIAARPTFLDGTKTAGLRDYELTDHLSNVMAVISDRKLSVDANSDTITDYYAPQVVSFTDYYPFGFPMAERSGNLSGYRFGFNGQESDNEVYGTKQSYTAEFWQYDTRLGRRWNVDPIIKQYESPYTTFANNPIIIVDQNGRDSVFVNQKGEIVLRIPDKKNFKTFIKTTNSASVENITKGWASVPMPNIIQTRTQSGENVSGEEYQENDYLIAARTGYFNQAKNAGKLKLYTQGGNSVPQDFVKSIPDLDPTLVKAMAIQESHNGVTGITDILQVNNVGDWGSGKLKYGMTKGNPLSITNSLYYGIRWLSSKGIRVIYNAETKQYEYSFKGWENAVGAYNGGGTANYQNYIIRMKNESKEPTPADY